MAYSKLYKAQSDVPVGYQTVNQLRDNLETHRDALAAHHGTGSAPFRSGIPMPPWKLSPYKALGKHDDPRIARAEAYVTYDAYGQPFLQWASPQIPGVVRISQGQFFVGVPGLTGFWAHGCLYEETDPTAAALSGDFGLMIGVRPYFPTPTAGGSPGLFVQVNRRTGGNTELADGVDFSIACYALGV